MVGKGRPLSQLRSRRPMNRLKSNRRDTDNVLRRTYCTPFARQPLAYKHNKSAGQA